MAETCNTCGLPPELCVCEDVVKSQQTIEVHTEERSYNKVVTVMENFDTDETNLDNLSSKLKSKFACGGTVEGDRIEIQGDHMNGVIEYLEGEGYEVKT
jgi:translation initiation factor 1